MSNEIFNTVKSIVDFHTNKIRLKLMFYSLLTGLLTGIIVSMYTKALKFVQNLRELLISNFSGIRFFFIIFLFILISIILQYIVNKYPLISGSGIPQVMALLKNKVKFNWIPELIFKFFGGIASIFLGFSLGREGPSIHLGALIGQGINSIVKTNEIEKKYIITCGSSAGLAAAFNAPLSGAIFAIEELHKIFSPILLICVLFASIFGNLISKFILGAKVSFNGFSFISPIEYNFKNILVHLILITILSIIIVIFAKLFNKSIISFKDFYDNLKLNKNLKLSIYSLISLIIIIYFPKISGGGHSLIENILKANLTIKFLIILLLSKFIFTIFSYSTSLPGGIFLPVLVIGALIGQIYGQILVNIFEINESYITLYVLISMTAFFSAVVKSPITGIILILEMSGNFSNLFVLVLASSISYFISELLKQESVYEILYNKSFEHLNEIDKKEKITTIKIPIARNSYIAGKMIKDIKWPDNFLIVGIERNGSLDIIPNGETIINELDSLILLTDNETKIKNEDKILKMTGIKE